MLKCVLRDKIIKKEEELKLSIPDTKFNHLIEYIIKEYDSYGPIKKDGKVVFSRLANSSDLYLFSKKTQISFKNIVFPAIQETGYRKLEKIALIGLNNCDVWSFHRLWDQFKKTNILVNKEDVLIIGMECKPDQNCFCGMVGANEYAPFDLFIQEAKNEIEVFSGSTKGTNILKTIGLKQKDNNLVLRKIGQDKNKYDQKLISSVIDKKAKNLDLWQSISNNCFGCGACSAVCPLCFCFRQTFENTTFGKSVHNLKWDSCFAKCFSEIQNRHDFRPTNTDRFYNWYHHKFVRSYFQNKYPLCTGCGRCITACPANLNVKNIIKLLVERNT